MSMGLRCFVKSTFVDRRGGEGGWGEDECEERGFKKCSLWKSRESMF